jgi:hypothetical protein
MEEFYASFEASQAGRFQHSRFDGPGEGVCWMLEEAGYSCLYRVNRDVLWIFATNLTDLETAKSAFGQFP